MAMNKQRKTGNILNIVSYDTSGNVTLPAALSVGTIHNPGYTQFLKPAGGSYVTQVSLVTGAIAVSLPVGMTDSMMRITIKIYEYTTNQSFEVHAGGYTYSVGNTWANNPFAYIVGNPGVDRRFNVRFGYNSTSGKAVIYIGELNTVWSYPQVHVTEIQIGYSGMTASWLNACTVAFETSAFQNQTAIISSSQVGYAVSTNTANSVVLRDGSGNFAAGAITATSLSATNVIASNFSDSTGSYNVNLGSGGSEGRGVAAGYSGTAYSGIGYNVRHTASSAVYLAPGSDTSSYLLFTGGGFAFYGAPAGTPGRTISYTTLGSFSAAGTFNAINVTVGGNQALHVANYNSYAPTLTGTGASGTWGISITGSASSSTNALRIVFNDGPRDLSDRLPNSFTRTVNFDFVGAGTAGGTGNYAGVMSFHPWSGTTVSTGDSSYQLAFINESSQNGAGLPGLRLRKGIDTTWGPWYSLLHAGNYNSYSPTLTGTGASGTWGISISGNAATATSAVSLSSSNFITRGGTSGNYNTDFTNTNPGTYRYLGDDATITNSPGGSWWFVENFRHYNAQGVWGTQVAWGWEDNANRLATRNVTSGTFGGWVYYLNTNNYNTYTPTLTGVGASGTWGINISGNAASASTVTVGASNATADWFPIVWHSGSYLYSSSGTAQIFPATGYARFSFVNTTDNVVTAATYFVVKNGDDYHRSTTPTSAADIIRGVASGTWGINITGNSNNITQYTINQNLGTANGPTFTEIYNNGWFRNNAAFTGLYNSTTTQHWSSKDNGYWDASSTNTVSAIRFFTGGLYGTIRAYVFANSSNEVGFQNQDGLWMIRCANLSNSYVTGTLTASADLIAYSDARVKENIQTVEDALSIVTKLRGVTYNRIDVEDKSRKVGVIAQEIMEVLPEVVKQGDDGMYGVSYGNIVGVLIEAIKEQQLKIDDLQKQIDYLGENK